MKAGWQTKSFEDCIQDVTYTSKIQRRDFLGSGKFPVISQEQEFINGYWDHENDLYLIDSPVVIFGDHTKVLKFVDFNFVLGADGVKILSPRKFLLPKFFYYRLQTADLDSLGYARHYKLLRELQISYPSLLEQQRIVTILDEAFEAIATARASAEKNLQNTRALFDSYLQSIFICRGEGWTETTLDKISINLDSKRIPITKSDRKKGQYPYYGASGIVDYVASYIFDDDVLLISEDGANLLARSTPIAFSVSGKCWVNNHAHILKFPYVATQRFVEFYFTSIKLDEYITGAAQPKLNQKALNSIPIPIPLDVDAQSLVVQKFELLQIETRRLESFYEKKLAALDELKKSLLNQAFSGELTKHFNAAVVIPFPAVIKNIEKIELHAGVLAMTYLLHEKHKREKYVGHVKAEKTAHLVESLVGIDLGRDAYKDAAGPNDAARLKDVEEQAEKAGYFSFKQVDGGRYVFNKLPQFESLIARTRQALGERCADVDHLLELMLPMNKRKAELFATVYAAWNNLLLLKKPAGDEEIVREAREEWHPDKMNIPREEFFATLAWIRQNDVIPQGKGRLVGPKKDPGELLSDLDA